MLAEILALFERGALRHPPITTWDLRRAPEAFRHLREGRNVGKVVLRVPQPLDPERTVLITGATGGLGALIARHLAARHGARHLLLASRSRLSGGGRQASWRQSSKSSAPRSTIAACDVADRDAAGGAARLDPRTSTPWAR